MKHLIPFIAFLFVTSLFAEPPRKVEEADPMPQDGFKTFADLSAWASSSSFGGGHAGELTLSDRKVYYSDRMVTSGVPTAELIFYVQTMEERIRPFIIVPTQRKEFRVEVEGNEIITRAYDPKKKKWLIALQITPQMLPDEIKPDRTKPPQPTAVTR